VKTLLPDYLIKHWRGELPLAQAFWINLVVLMIILGLLERLMFPPFIEQELAVTGAVIVYSLVVKLVIYPWQAVGVLRSCGLRIKSDSGRLWASAAQVGVVISLAVILLTTIETFQSLQIYKRNLLVEKIISPEPGYSLDLIGQGSLIHLRGPFEIGITSKLADLIERNPQVTGIILDSEGGQIYEGRGLARLIGENGLRTYTLDQCLSSCTTAFVAGELRTLGYPMRGLVFINTRLIV